jgi:hypothetical protein
MIDHHHRYRHLLRLQLEPELFFDSSTSEKAIRVQNAIMQYGLVEAAASDGDWLENSHRPSTRIFSKRLGAAGMKRDINDSSGSV